MTWCSGGIGAGASGGLSRTTNGAGLIGSGGFCRISFGVTDGSMMVSMNCL